MPIVNGLEKVYGAKMKFQVKGYKDGDSPELIKKYDLGRHGMVITDGEGKALWSEHGHMQDRAGVEKAIKKALGT